MKPNFIFFCSIPNPTHSHLTFNVIDFIISSLFHWFWSLICFNLILFWILLLLFQFTIRVLSRQSICISCNIWSKTKNCCWIICRVIWRILKYLFEKNVFEFLEYFLESKTARRSRAHGTQTWGMYGHVGG